MGLSKANKATFIKLVRPILGLDDSVPQLSIDRAGTRLDAMLSGLPEHEADAAAQVNLLLEATRLIAKTQRQLDFDGEFDMDEFVRWLMLGRPSIDVQGVTVRDMGKGLRELAGIAYYSQHSTDAHTKYERLWDRKDIWTRPDVDEAHRPAETPLHLDGDALRSAHIPDRIDGSAFMKAAPSKRIAVIGSGAGGAVVAARLAKLLKGQGFAIGVFEAGPRIRASEFPLDTMAGMNLMYEKGLFALTKNLDMHLLRGRLVGGSTVLTSGLTIRPPATKLQAWISGGMGLDASAMGRGISATGERMAVSDLHDELITTPHTRLEQAAHQFTNLEGEALWGITRCSVNVVTPGQAHPLKEDESATDPIGDSCVGCGMCNYGCRFGHKLSVDKTYLPDAERDGVEVFSNHPVKRLDGIGEEGRWRATHVWFQNGEARKVGHVVLAAGAVGSAALVLRSKLGAHLEGAAAVAHRHVGKNLAFNFGTSVAARFPDDLEKPAMRGHQIRFVAERAQDVTTRYLLEPFFIPPALLSNVVPGIGATHRKWMADYTRLGLCANTIGSGSQGTIDAEGEVKFAISDNELDLVHESLAEMVQLYLQAGAEEVGISGIRPPHQAGDTFAAGDLAKGHGLLVKRIQEMITSPDQLVLSSAHPQGGLRMNVDPSKGAVDGQYHLHGMTNVAVADASLFPTSITVNPQWTVMALAHAAAESIAERIKAQHRTD